MVYALLFNFGICLILESLQSAQQLLEDPFVGLDPFDNNKVAIDQVRLDS